MNAYKWSTTAANNNASVPDGAPNGWLGQNVNEWARETMARVREHLSDASYIDETYQLGTPGAKTLTRMSSSQIKIGGCDATSVFTTDRRVRMVGATTVYEYVVSSSYSAPDTTVTVTTAASGVPTTPTQILVHTDAKIRSGAYYKTGSGNNLNADLLDSYHALDIFGPTLFSDALVNGSMMIWQRGTSGSCPINTRTYHADRWWTNPAGAAVAVARTTTTPTGAVSPYAKVITGATSVTTCEIAGQRIESYLIPYIKTSVLISMLVKNDTAADLEIDLLLGTPAATDDFTTVTNRATTTLIAVGAGTSARVSDVIDISGFTNINNGLEIKFRTPSGALDSGTKSVTITEIQIDRATVFSYFKLRPLEFEINRCKRYYQKTFAYETAPAQNWAGSAGFVAGSLVIPGSTVGGSSDNSGVTWNFSVPMRATPTVTTYNPAASAATARAVDASTTKTVTATASTNGVNLSINATTSAFTVGATAESEL